MGTRVLHPRLLLTFPWWGTRHPPKGEALRIQLRQVLCARVGRMVRPAALLWSYLEGRIETSSSTFLLVWKSNVPCPRCLVWSRSRLRKLGLLEVTVQRRLTPPAWPGMPRRFPTGRRRPRRPLLRPCSRERTWRDAPSLHPWDGPPGMLFFDLFLSSLPAKFGFFTLTTFLEQGAPPEAHSP